MTSAEARLYYDAWKDYEQELLADGYYVPFRLVEQTLPYLASCQSILDVGCGTGLVGLALRRKGWSGRLVGLDLSQSRLAEAKKRPGVYQRLTIGNAYRLHASTGFYSAVVSSAVLGLAGPRALTEMIRVTKPGGIISVAVGDLLTSKKHRQRFQRIARRINQGLLTNLVAEFDLGSGYSHGRTDERYHLYILRKRPIP